MAAVRPAPTGAADPPARRQWAHRAGARGATPSQPGAPAPRDGYQRSFDLAVLLVGGVLLAPVWVPLALGLAALIRVADGGPALYRQRRLGRGGAAFEMLKFRTMAVGAERTTGAVWAVQADGRATRLGRWLRRTRIDELPQALNVLCGEMSIVGPRPERPELMARCEREAPGFGRRLAVRPGIAGLAQARRGALARPRAKLSYDLLYIGAMSPWLDLKLCAASLARALREALRPPPAGSAVSAAVALVTGITGQDGTPRTVFDPVPVRALGRRPRVGLAEGLARTCRWVPDHVDTIRERGR